LRTRRYNKTDANASIFGLKCRQLFLGSTRSMVFFFVRLPVAAFNMLHGSRKLKAGFEQSWIQATPRTAQVNFWIQATPTRNTKDSITQQFPITFIVRVGRAKQRSYHLVPVSHRRTAF
jgi:hypothetical protein